MKARRYLSLCLLAGVVAFGVGLAASWLLGRAASATDGSGAAAAVAPDPVVLDGTVDASGAASTIHVAKFEVTIAEWNRCAADGSCSFTPRGRPGQSDDHPVTGVRMPT